MKIKTFQKGGIHPPENKLTSGKPVEPIAIAPELIIMLSQCIGAPSKPNVKTGDEVVRGQMIAEAGGFMGVPIHSPVNGKVKKVEVARNLQGMWQNAIIITPDSENPLEENFNGRSQEEIDSFSSTEIIRIISQAGIVGLGGATFPTHVKLTVPLGKKIDTVLINGAECEPYLTCDDILMQTEASKIISGALLIKRATGAERIIIGIEKNKPAAIRAMAEEAKSREGVEVVALKKKYPQGSEKQLIQALTGRVVPSGLLPLDVHCVVDNVATAFSIYEALYEGKPLMERIVTVTGIQMEKPGNYLVYNGTPLSFLMETAGGIPENTGKIIAGGPMMGKAISNLDAGATKGLSGLIAMPEKLSLRKEPGPCIRCSACLNVCPMGLEPYLFMQQAENSYWDDMKSHGVLNCIECGCCTYTCPASRPLLDFIKLGKTTLRNKKS